MKFWRWIAGFWEHKGERSSKRATLFAFVVLDIVLNIIFTINVSDPVWKFHQLTLNKITVLLILGVITTETIIQFVQLIKGKNDKDNNDNSSEQ